MREIISTTYVKKMIKYEYPFVKLSSSKRDEDNNSEFDRFEARLDKKDESLSMQNKVICEQTIQRIDALYGPFYDNEIQFYRKRLLEGNKSVINSFQYEMICYFFFKNFGDPKSILPINEIAYIKMILAARNILLSLNMTILPYIIAGKSIRIASRKNLSKKEIVKIEETEMFRRIMYKYYDNPKIKQKIFEMIGTIIMSEFKIIDYDIVNNCPGKYDRLDVPIVNDLIINEVLMFIDMIA